MDRFELNKKLLEAAKTGDLSAVGSLLQIGADPLGPWDEMDAGAHVLGELFEEASQSACLAEKLPRLVQMFLSCGMDIGKKNLPAHGGDPVDPLWSLAFCRDEHGLRTLKVLLDNALNASSAEALVEHILTDMDICGGCEVGDEGFLSDTVCALRMIMLAASYPHIIENSPYIRRCVELDGNRGELLPRFREWNGFEYHIDISTCTHIPQGLWNATLRIRDRGSREIVWVMKI